MNQKWLISITIFFLILFTTAVVFAQDGGQKIELQSGVASYAHGQIQVLFSGQQNMLGKSAAQQGQEQPGQVQTRLQVAAQVRGLLQQIREQRTQILQLRADNRSLCEQLRQRLRLIQDEGREIDEELALRLREQMRTILEERMELRESLGQIRGIGLQVRSKRAAGQYESIPGLYQGMSDIQENRIRLLQQIRTELQSLLSALE